MANKPSPHDIVVVDLGASYIRIGVHRKPIAPQVCVPTLLSTAKQSSTSSSGGSSTAGAGAPAATQKVYIGAAARRPLCYTRCPIENGKISSVEDVSTLLRHCYELLSLNPSQHRLLITECPHCDPLDRMTLAKVLFDDLHVPAAQTIPQGVAGLFALGRTSGMFIDSGESLTHIGCVVDGVLLPSTHRSTSAAGGAVTDEFMALLNQGRASQVSSRETVREWKERLCFAVADAEEDGAPARPDVAPLLQRELVLPDGQVVVVGAERFLAVENALFRSHDRAFRSSIAEAFVASLGAAEPGLQPQVATRIAVVGGNNMMGGVADRVLRDAQVSPKVTRLGVRLLPLATAQDAAPSDLNWIGAALFASLPSVAEMFVDEALVREEGLAAFAHSRMVE